MTRTHKRPEIDLTNYTDEQMQERVKGFYIRARRRKTHAAVALHTARKDAANGFKATPYEGQRIHAPFASGSLFNRLGVKGEGWCEEQGLRHLRRLGYSDELDTMNHKGWFSDTHQDSVMRGVVYLLPQRKDAPGTATYLVGYEDPDNAGCAYLERFEHEFDQNDPDYYDSDHREAARRADSIAESNAEEAREYDEHWQANSTLAQAAKEVTDALDELQRDFNSMRFRTPDRREYPVQYTACIRDVRDSRDYLVEKCREYRATADSLTVYGDPLDHASAADHDKNNVLNVRWLIEALENLEII